MTPAELIAALHPPRLPEGTATLGPGALVAAFGLGLLLALAAFALVRPVLRARLRPAGAEALLARLRTLPPEARPLAAARIFAALGASLPEAVVAALYRPGAVLDPDAVGPALVSAWRAADRPARMRADA